MPFGFLIFKFHLLYFQQLIKYNRQPDFKISMLYKTQSKDKLCLDEVPKSNSTTLEEVRLLPTCTHKFESEVLKK